MPQKGFSAIIIVILIVILAGAVLGGIYFYTQIYQPQQYAKGVISLFDGITEGFPRTNPQVEGKISKIILIKEFMII